MFSYTASDPRGCERGGKSAGVQQGVTRWVLTCARSWEKTEILAPSPRCRTPPQTGTAPAPSQKLSVQSGRMEVQNDAVQALCVNHLPKLTTISSAQQSLLAHDTACVFTRFSLSPFSALPDEEGLFTRNLTVLELANAITHDCKQQLCHYIRVHGVHEILSPSRMHSSAHSSLTLPTWLR